MWLDDFISFEVSNESVFVHFAVFIFPSINIHIICEMEVCAVRRSLQKKFLLCLFNFFLVFHMHSIGLLMVFVFADILFSQILVATTMYIFLFIFSTLFSNCSLLSENQTKKTKQKLNTCIYIKLFFLYIFRCCFIL